MTVPGAYTFKNWSLTLDSQDVSSQIAKVELTPDVSTATLKTAVPAGVIQDTGLPVWTLDLTGVQNHTATTGLATILWDAQGTDIAFVFVPEKVEGQVQYSGTVRAQPLKVGGETEAWNTSDVSLLVQGQPTKGTYSEE